jgi:hypothetical protein
MLRLGQDKVNTIWVNLSDAAVFTGTPIYYLFQFISETTNDEVIFTTPDVSQNVLRYNQFNITVTGSTQNLTAGTINLNPKGEYIYNVYDMYSPTNLAISGTSGVIIKTGILQVTGTSLSYITQDYTGHTDSYGFYQP